MRAIALDSRQASVIAALLVWVTGMPLVLGLCAFFGMAAWADALICAGGALAGLACLALRPWWRGPAGALAACLPFMILGGVGALAEANWAAPANVMIAVGFALGLALRAPLARLAALALCVLLGALVLKTLWQPPGLASQAWAFLAAGALVLAAGLGVISLSARGGAPRSMRLFLEDIAPVDRMAVLAALEAAWAKGDARAENLQFGRGGARSLTAMRRQGALQVRWAALAAAPANPQATQGSESGPAPFSEREIAELAHEMRTPLHQILGFAELIEAEMLGPIEASYAEYAGLIGVSGRHLLDLTDAWLERARLLGGTRVIEAQDFDLQELVAEALRGFGRLAQLKRISLSLEGEACFVRADRRAWRQIVINLIGNALKFTPEAGTVRVLVHARGGSAMLAVEDSGPGIAAEDRARILRPFERAANAAQHDGVGLGLSIVLALLRLHEGDLEIGQASLGGARFCASAPIGQAAAGPPGERAVAGFEVD